jgi:serine/threonine-protein kinase RsbW
VAVETTPAVVELSIPCRPEFVSVARLAMLGVASRMQFTYDEVEDIRLAVGEACTTAVGRAMNANKTNAQITIRSEILENKLTIEVEDKVGRMPEVTAAAAPPESLNEENLGALLMELLVDEFTVEPTAEGGTRVRMVKYAG